MSYDVTVRITVRPGLSASCNSFNQNTILCYLLLVIFVTDIAYMYCPKHNIGLDSLTGIPQRYCAIFLPAQTKGLQLALQLKMEIKAW